MTADGLDQVIDSVLADHSSVGRAAELNGRADHDLWALLADRGFLAVAVDEASGGSGGTLEDAGAVVRACGRYCAGVPISEVGLVGGWLLEQTAIRLPGGRWTASVAPLRAVATPAGLRVTGVAERVPYARDASTVVVPALDGEGQPYVALVPVAGEHLSSGANIAGEPRDTLAVDVLLADDTHYATTSAEVIAEAGLRAAAGRVLLIEGALAAVCDLTVRYAEARYQFGRPLRGQQAVQQQLAALVEESATVAAASAGALEALERRDGRAEFAVAAAKVRSAQAATTAAALAHQIHGAMGMTHEYPLRLLTTRMWSWCAEFGNERAWSERLGRLVLDPQSGGVWPAMAPT